MRPSQRTAHLPQLSPARKQALLLVRRRRATLSSLAGFGRTSPGISGESGAAQAIPKLACAFSRHRAEADCGRSRALVDCLESKFARRRSDFVRLGRDEHHFEGPRAADLPGRAQEFDELPLLLFDSAADIDDDDDPS